MSNVLPRTLLRRAAARAPPRKPSLVGASVFASVNAGELTERVFARLRPMADAKCVDLVLHCTCGAVWVDPQTFPDALYELVDNSVRATRRGYPVIIDVRAPEDGGVLWQVQDAGEGMADRALARLAQLPCGASSWGSGLGVARAWAVIVEHGGLLRFESALRVGTTVSVWLPNRVR